MASARRQRIAEQPAEAQHPFAFTACQPAAAAAAHLDQVATLLQLRPQLLRNELPRRLHAPWRRGVGSRGAVAAGPPPAAAPAATPSCTTATAACRVWARPSTLPAAASRLWARPAACCHGCSGGCKPGGRRAQALCRAWPGRGAGAAATAPHATRWQLHRRHAVLLRGRRRRRRLLRAKGVQALEHLGCLRRHVPRIPRRHCRHAQ